MEITIELDENDIKDSIHDRINEVVENFDWDEAVVNGIDSCGFDFEEAVVEAVDFDDLARNKVDWQDIATDAVEAVAEGVSSADFDALKERVRLQEAQLALLLQQLADVASIPRIASQEQHIPNSGVTYGATPTPHEAFRRAFG